MKSSNLQSFATKDHYKVLKTEMTFLSYLARDQAHRKLLPSFDLDYSKTAEIKKFLIKGIFVVVKVWKSHADQWRL